jgi:hypothetical protein
MADSASNAPCCHGPVGTSATAVTGRRSDRCGDAGSRVITAAQVRPVVNDAVGRVLDVVALSRRNLGGPDGAGAAAQI